MNYLDSMRHHGHFMQRGLTVENDEIVVSDVTLHFVPDLEMKIRRLWMISEEEVEEYKI